MTMRLLHPRQRPRVGSLPSKALGERGGLSLMEVLLSLAIMGVAMAAIGELTRVGMVSSGNARDLTTAQILCESVMSEITAGILAPQPVTLAPVDDPQHMNDWVYTIEVQPVGQDGLLTVAVTVGKNPSVYPQPVTTTLVRWMIDPEVLMSMSSSYEETY